MSRTAASCARRRPIRSTTRPTRQNVEAIRGELAEQFPTLHLVGRNGMHKYNNQDHAMMTAMLTVKNILAGEIVYDVWNVNEDAEYHEAGEAGTQQALDERAHGAAPASRRRADDGRHRRDIAPAGSSREVGSCSPRCPHGCARSLSVGPAAFPLCAGERRRAGARLRPLPCAHVGWHEPDAGRRHRLCGGHGRALRALQPLRFRFGRDRQEARAPVRRVRAQRA